MYDSFALYISENLTFLHFCTLICVKKICDAYNIYSLRHLQFYNLSIHHVSHCTFVISNLYRIHIQKVEHFLCVRSKLYAHTRKIEISNMRDAE